MGIDRNEISAPSSLDPPDTQILARLQTSRRSCRGFLSKPIPEGTLNRAFGLAQLAASWCNAQPWKVIVTRGAGTERFRDALYSLAVAESSRPVTAGVSQRSDLPMPNRYSGQYNERRRESGMQLYNAMGVMGDRVKSAKCMLENFRLFGAPHAVILTSARELGAYGVLDTGCYIANLMLVLQSFGVASIAQAALAVYGDYIHSFFDIPQDRIVVCGMSIGYSDASHPSSNFDTRRAGVEEVLTWYD